MQRRKSSVKSIIFEKEYLLVLNQRYLPNQEVFVKVDGIDSAFKVIREMVVRGAPLIGVTAGYSVYLEALNTYSKHSTIGAMKSYLLGKVDILAKARPTAVNLKWALNRMKHVILESISKADLLDKLLKEAHKIETEEKHRCNKIAEHGLSLLRKRSRVLTICNTGKLATPGIGTALGLIYHAYDKGLIEKVYVSETRPWLQGARLTAYELSMAGIPHCVIIDSAGPFLISKGIVDLVVVGADRVARNGDTANKIGTLSLAIACKEFGIPFYVAAPLSSFDLSIESGDEIELEIRNSAELKSHSSIPQSSSVINYVFDITPGRYITAFITDKGILSPPFDE